LQPVFASAIIFVIFLAFAVAKKADTVSAKQQREVIPEISESNSVVQGKVIGIFI
jgi:hypothetical protein